MLLPWCCIAAFAHILKTFEAIATELEFHYELDSGSARRPVHLWREHQGHQRIVALWLPRHCVWQCAVHG